MPLPARAGGGASIGERRVTRSSPLKLRLLGAFIALAFAFLLPFLAPDGARTAMLGSHADDPAYLARIDATEHFGETVPVQFVRFVAGVVHGDFGRSYVQAVDVRRAIGRHLPLTVALVALTVAVTANAFGSAIVFIVLALEAVFQLPGLGKELALAIDRRDLVLFRGVFAVALLVCVIVGPARRRGASRAGRVVRAVPAGAAWAWCFAFALVIAFAQRLPVPNRYAYFARHGAPSGAHWLGTDDLGHDVLARLVGGAAGTAVLALVATAAAFAIGMLAGILVREWRAGRHAVNVVGRLGIPSIALSMGLAAVCSREQGEFWQWLVPLAVMPALEWASGAFDGRVPDLADLRGAGAAALTAVAHVIAGEALLGAFGLVPVGALTWGTILNDVRTASYRPIGELVAVLVAVVVTVVALRRAACDLVTTDRSATPRIAGTMV